MNTNELKEKQATAKWMGWISLTIALGTIIWCSMNTMTLMK